MAVVDPGKRDSLTPKKTICGKIVESAKNYAILALHSPKSRGISPL